MNKYKRVINVRSQKAYDELMVQLESRDFLWASDRLPTSIDKWYIFGRKTLIWLYLDIQAITYDEMDSITEAEDIARIELFKPTDTLRVEKIMQEEE